MLIPILIAIAILIPAGLAIVLVARMQQKTRSRTIQVEIHNLGNVQSRYELQATDPEGSLKFQFTLGGDALPQAAERAEEKHPQRVPSVRASAPAVQHAFQDSGVELVLAVIRAEEDQAIGGGRRRRAKRGQRTCRQKQQARGGAWVWTEPTSYVHELISRCWQEWFVC